MGNVADNVRQAPDIKAALIALAEGIDALLTQPAAPAGDSFMAWADDNDARFVAAQAGSDGGPVSRPVRDEAAIADLRARVAASAGEDRLALEAALRLADENGFVVDDSPEEGQRPTVEEDGDSVTVEIPPPSPERMDARVAFCEQNKLWEFQTGSPASNLDEATFTDAYAKGGPVWLYYGDRAGVLSMPAEWRQQLIADVELDSPALAREIGRDVLMFRGPQDQSNTSAMNA